MNPAEICTTILGPEKLAGVIEELSAPQIKAVLKEGSVRVKLPGGYVSQQKRRKLWSTKILAAIDRGNDSLCGELLQQWLLNHRRQMLIDYLDRLEIKHRDGETDESFLVTCPVERARDAASWLMDRHDRRETLAYLHYIAHQQRSTVFDEWDDAAPAPTAAAGQPEPGAARGDGDPP